MLALIGFLWAIFAPECYGESFAFPLAIGAGALGYVFGRQGDAQGAGQPPHRRPVPRTDPKNAEKDKELSVLNVLLGGWVCTMFAAPVVGLGWFLGGLACFNLLPEFGDYRCIHCLEASRQ